MKHKMSMRILALTLTWMLCLSAISSTLVSRAIAEGDWDEEEELYLEEEFVMLDDDGNEIPVDAWDTDGGESNGAEETQEHTPRDEFIDRIVALGQKLYEGAGGKAQRAHYAGDIYVCKNFTVYLFRKTRDDFRMAEYPDVSLVIPDNLPAKDCKPYAYGILWKDIAASKGNPFEIAETFRYDTALSKEENMEKAMDFMRKVQRGDYFQMSADYEYGVGAHS
ncbi:MAG: hypothetical protein IJ083_08490, partial [Clostridia bacterium]|nr:hypothetical protein [Clostridia bacterium]